MQQLAEDGGDRPQVAKRIKSLEKEVHYYKKLCKELSTRREEDPDIEHHQSSRRDYDHGFRSPDHGLRSPDHGLRNHSNGLREHSTRAPHHQSSRNNYDEETPRRGARHEHAERIEVVTREEERGDGGSDTESTVSQIQPSQIAQFQRKLARLHRWAAVVQTF